jgi:small subunit ribosomal protein S16
MVVIRLARGGSKKRPFYRIVVTDSRNPRDGRYIERLGYYNPVPTGQDVPLAITGERVQFWLERGAQMSEQVKGLLKRAKKSGLAPTTPQSEGTTTQK